MADKYYLDEEGLRRLVDFIRQQVDPNTDAIKLLNKTDGTPGSIQRMIDDAIEEPTRIYGGSASAMIGEE